MVYFITVKNRTEIQFNYQSKSSFLGLCLFAHSVKVWIVRHNFLLVGASYCTGLLLPRSLRTIAFFAEITYIWITTVDMYVTEFKMWVVPAWYKNFVLQSHNALNTIQSQTKPLLLCVLYGSITPWGAQVWHASMLVKIGKLRLQKQNSIFSFMLLMEKVLLSPTVVVDGQVPTTSRDVLIRVMSFQN